MATTATNRGPRFVFVTDQVGSRPARYGWRLDAANHRPLGRGVGTHASYDDCLGWLDALRVDHRNDGVDAAVSFDSARGLWTWRLTRDGATCAVAVRTYLRRFECRRAVAHFRQGLGDITPESGVVRVVRTAVLDRYDLGASAAAS